MSDASNSPEETSAALAGLGSATLGESGGRAAHRRLRPAWPGAAVAAPVYPVGCTPGDNLAVHVAVTKAPRGSVLAVDVGQVSDRGYWGRDRRFSGRMVVNPAPSTGIVRDVGRRPVEPSLPSTHNKTGSTHRTLDPQSRIPEFKVSACRINKAGGAR